MTRKESGNPRSWCWLDGEVTAATEAHIGIVDRGLLYGDSVFETFRTLHRRGIFVEAHLDRLSQGARLLKIELEYDQEFLQEAIEQVIRCHPDDEDVVIRITLTRGDRLGGEVGPRSCRSRLMVSSSALADSSIGDTAGVSAVVVSHRKIPPCCINPNVKSGNYLSSILARDEAEICGADEGILLSPDGFVTEAACSNLFWISEGQVYTCSDDLVLAGITRSKVLEILEQTGIPCHLGHHRCEHLESASAAFLTGSIRGIIPIRSLQHRLLDDAKGLALIDQLSDQYWKEVEESISRSVR